MGGNGFMRLIEFLNDGRTVQVQTYSPYLDQWLTNDRNLFQLELSPLYAGDYNEDGMIDAADYTVWRDAITSGGTSLANDSTPGTVDESDFLYWRAHFGESFRSGANAASGVVPEPSMLVLLLTALLLLPTRILPFCSPIRSPCRPIH